MTEALNPYLDQCDEDFKRQVEEAMIQCPECEGQGRVLIAIRRVTRDMAIDACEPEMEGMEIEELQQCNFCGGDGSYPR